MTDKKEWYETIPENGVLCKTASDAIQLVHIRNKRDLAEFCCDYAVDETVLTPITPAEWWQFAPFQDMKTAPENTELLLLDNDGFIVPIDKISKGRVECHGNELPLLNFKGWLPLHQSKINA